MTTKEVLHKIEKLNWIHTKLCRKCDVTKKEFAFYDKWKKRLEGYQLKILKQFVTKKAVDFAKQIERDPTYYHSYMINKELYDKFNQ